LRDGGFDLGAELFSEAEFETLAEVDKAVAAFSSSAAAAVSSGSPAPTLCHGMSTLVNLRTFSERWSRSVDATVCELAQAFAAELQEAFPDGGSGDHLLRMGNLLHPYYKGLCLKVCFHEN
jgi:hypothetical protein